VVLSEKTGEFGNQESSNDEFLMWRSARFFRILRLMLGADVASPKSAWKEMAENLCQVLKPQFLPEGPTFCWLEVRVIYRL